MAQARPYSRRKFLKQASQAASGFLLVSSTPSLLKSQCLINDLVYVERAFYTMGTTVTISAYGEDRAHLNQAITKAFEEIQCVDDLMSLYKPASQVSTINRLAGKEAIGVGKSMLDIIQLARQFYDITNGAFDVTIEPLMELWGFRNKSPLHTIPSDKEIYRLLEAVGIRNIEVNEGARTIGLLNEHSKIDLGGIAVGYSVDRAVEVLQREGIQRAFVNHSGDAYALGAPPETDGWKVAIPNPLDMREVISTFTLRNKAASTSGNYEKFIEAEGQRFGHILNPHSGKPSEAMLSATIIADRAVTADALSTGVFCVNQSEIAPITSRSKNVRLQYVIETEHGIEIKYL